MNAHQEHRFRALVIDDEADIRELLEITLQRMGADTWSAANVAAAIELLESQEFDICLTDMRLPDGSGMDILRHIQAHLPQLPTAVITAYGNVEDAVNSLKAGAFDFVSKPVDLNSLQALITKAVSLPKQTAPANKTPQLIGSSPSIERLRVLISKLARSQAPVYISGESGTGKELVARQIHAQGPRAKQAFVPVNCGAIPAELMESELFGHIKGSFTGAIKDNPGLFKLADGGTLFLDEVAELPLHMQVKLLRAIQERKLRPVGGQGEEAIDVRILCATHKPLAQLVDAGKFRQDLYYRLNVIQIDVPSLRSRREDIPQLCREILKQIAQRHHRATPQLTDSALAALNAYPFPGNVRELENILERALTLAEHDEITDSDLLLPDTKASSEKTTDLNEQILHQEKAMIQQALEATRHNKTKAAELLGLSFRQLRYRLKKLGIE